jgi:hypothetical protein
MGGSWVVEALQRFGITGIVLIDPDTVEPHNLSSQNFTVDHLGKAKVDYFKGAQGFNGRFPDDLKGGVDRYHTIFNLSDSLDVRRAVFDAAYSGGTVRYIVDIRAVWPSFEWYIVDMQDPKAVQFYLDAGFQWTDADVPNEAECSKVGTLPHAWVNCGLPLHHWGNAVAKREFIPWGSFNIETLEVCTR